MNNIIKCIEFDKIDYNEAWQLQQQLHEQVIEQKNGLSEPFGYLILCEHNHVYTIGKSGSAANLLINDDFLSKIDAKAIRIDRGGDITYHGQGQLVGYPIIDLENYKIGIKEYVNKIEEVIIQTISEFGIKAGRLASATGVWLDPESESKVRKICAIGIKAGRFVTMHGFALNINTDLSYFNYINPCGFTDKGVTSMQKELNSKINTADVIKVLKTRFSEVFGADICETKP